MSEIYPLRATMCHTQDGQSARRLPMCRGDLPVAEEGRKLVPEAPRSGMVYRYIRNLQTQSDRCMSGMWLTRGLILAAIATSACAEKRPSVPNFAGKTDIGDNGSASAQPRPNQLAMDSLCMTRCASVKDCCVPLITLQTCQPMESAVCMDGFCRQAVCGQTGCPLCVEEDGALRCTHLCDADANCQECPEWSKVCQPGDRCVQGVCRHPIDCDASWCNSKERLAMFRRPECSGGKCVYLCTSDDDCVYRPNTEHPNNLAAACVNGECHLTCDTASCSGAPGLAQPPAGFGCAPALPEAL